MARSSGVFKHGPAQYNAASRLRFAYVRLTSSLNPIMLIRSQNRQQRDGVLLYFVLKVLATIAPRTVIEAQLCLNGALLPSYLSTA